MIKIILFDCDGVLVHRHKYFSKRIKEDLGIEINMEAVENFFANEFLLCETGKLDLKQELSKQLPLWNLGWSVEKVMEFWFEGERERDEQVVGVVEKLREKGIQCFMSTNNEKHRTKYLSEKVGLNKVLDGIFSSAFLGYMKPDLNFWDAIYRKFPNYEKSEFLVFDNKENMANSAKEFDFNSEFYVDLEKLKKQLEKYNLS